VPPHEYRGHEILITVTRFDDRVRVETEILLPSNIDERSGSAYIDADTESVTTLASEDINLEALMSAKRAVDVIIAERSALAKGRQ
jgi:hypothetical protein